MSILFSSKKIGTVEIANRIVHSATYECMAKDTGEITPEMEKRYRNLSKGGVGLIIPGYLYVHPMGKAVPNQAGIHSDKMIPGLKGLTEVVHEDGSKVVFQLVHAGRQTFKKVIGQTPMAPSEGSKDYLYRVKPKAMTEEEIHEVIKAFGAAAKRAYEAGADGVQIHAAHGYLINQFLSPFYNKREDLWGGSDEGRFHFAKEVIHEVKNAIPDEMPIIAKLNTQDYTPEPGITPPLAKKYAEWMVEHGVNGVEVSCGTGGYSIFNMCRGDVPTRELVMNYPWPMKTLAKLSLKKFEGKFDLEEGYNIEAAKLIKPAIGDIPLFLVGGMRKVKHMEEVIENRVADFISLCRPLIREPFLINKIKEGKTDSASCVSCNKCVAAVGNDLPVRCYNKGFPK